MLFESKHLHWSVVNRVSLFDRYILDLAWNILVECRRGESTFTISVIDAKCPAAALKFMNFLLEQLQQSLILTKSDVLEVSKSQPMYGMTRLP